MRWFNKHPKNNELTETALLKAKEVFNSDPKRYKSHKFCPFCGSLLIKSGKQRRLVTLDEHVSGVEPSLKDEYICSNKSCLYGPLFVWEEFYGEAYHSDLYHTLIKNNRLDRTLKEIRNTPHSALNSLSLATARECYREGLDDKILLPAWLTFNKIQLYIQFSYASNYWGEIIKTYVDLGFLKKDENGVFAIVGSWFVSTWKYLSRASKRRINSYKSSKDINALRKAMCFDDSRTPYRLFRLWMCIRHPIYYRLVKNQKRGN